MSRLPTDEIIAIRERAERAIPAAGVYTVERHSEMLDLLVERGRVCDDVPNLAADLLVARSEIERLTAAEHERKMAIEDERDDLRDALREFVELEEPECRFDHNGDCQAHGVAPPPCYVAEARALLAGSAGAAE